MDSDFAVTMTFLDALVAMALQQEAPQAFAPNVDSASYHVLAIDRMRSYVRALEENLGEKRGTAQTVSISTYRTYASAMYCEPGPLISAAEVESTLAHIAQ